jgi:hypothetical protein
MEQQAKTIEQIQSTIRAARDSVWVINEEIQKLSAGGSLTDDARGTIERNVGHLKIIVADAEIVGSGEDISDLQTAITSGETTLAA